MFTQCPTCETVYSLSPGDLRAANGYVRCGNCDTTFSALSRLQDTPPVQADDHPPEQGTLALDSQDGSTKRMTAAEPVPSTGHGNGTDEGQNDVADESNTDTQEIDENWSDELDEFEEDLGDEADGFDPEASEPSGDATTRLTVDHDDDYFRYAEARLDEPSPSDLTATPEAIAHETADHTAVSEPEPDEPPVQEAAEDHPAADPQPNALGFRDTLLDDDQLAGDEPIETRPVEPDAAQDPHDRDEPYQPADPDQFVDDAQDRRDILDYLRPGLSTGQKIAGGTLGILLLAALVAQAMHHWRGTLILDDRIGPPLQALYQRFDQRIAPAGEHRDYDVARHTIVTREDQTTVYQFRATVVNRSAGRRPYPRVRITFFDRFGDESYVRTFAAKEYLAAALPGGPWLASGAAVEVSLDLVDLDPDSSSNYYVEACMPIADKQVSCALPDAPRQRKP